jgi:hypothetical protein
MYHPYLRGKQFELITIRETANLMASSGFVPIIEPVKEGLTTLERALNAICEAGGNAIVIVNPRHGDHAGDGGDISTLLSKGFLEKVGIAAGILLTEDMGVSDALTCFDRHREQNPSFIHAGFTDAKALAQELKGNSKHVFFEKRTGKLYWRHFKGSERILLRDGYHPRLRNADYPLVEKFSDLHLTYKDDEMNGFGDFLIVGDGYSESGGPAYAVAIHLTFIDSDREDVMYIYHFISDSNDTPTDPAGKFAQALQKLIDKLNSGNSKLFEGEAIQEFRSLHKKGHFPGLGSVKKLSMKHHIETLANFFT